MITLCNQSMAHVYFLNRLVAVNSTHLEDFELELNTIGSVSWFITQAPLLANDNKRRSLSWRRTK
jgi:hypothetical protein